MLAVHERSPLAREACLEHWGKACAVSGFLFEQRYGMIGKGYIHVHPLVPLAQIGGSYTIDPVKDLRPVCPNCHAMLHIEEPPLSIAELQVCLQ